MIYRLAPDYQCHPVWAGEGWSYRNVDPRDLPISDELQEELATWAAAYDATLNWSDPGASGFRTAEQQAEFDETGRRLRHRLRTELGAGHEVRYFSVVTGWSE